MEDLLNHIFSSQWRVALFVTSLSLLLAELGFRQGLRLHGD
jgi:hypothetical protein